MAYMIFRQMFVASGTCFFGCSSEQVQEYDSNGNPVGGPWGTFGTGTITLTNGDASGNVYVADYLEQQHPEAHLQRSTSGDLHYLFPCAFKPYGIASDGTYLYVADKGNNRVVVFETSGTVITSWGGATLYRHSRGPVRSIGNRNRRSIPHSVCGRPRQYRIVSFSISAPRPRATYQTSWGTAGTANGPYSHYANSVAVDAATNIYVTDAGAS